MPKLLSKRQELSLATIKRLFINSKDAKKSIEECITIAQEILQDNFESVGVATISARRNQEQWDEKRLDPSYIDGDTAPSTPAPPSRPVPGGARRPVPVVYPNTDADEEGDESSSELISDVEALTDSITSTIGPTGYEAPVNIDPENIDDRQIALMVLKSVALLGTLLNKAIEDMANDDLSEQGRNNLTRQLVGVQRQLLQSAPLLTPYIEQVRRSRENAEATEKFFAVMERLDKLGALFPDVYGQKYNLSLDLHHAVERLTRLQSQVEKTKRERANVMSEDIDGRA